jgi:hypothetical protein
MLEERGLSRDVSVWAFRKPLQYRDVQFEQGRERTEDIELVVVHP